MDGQRSESLAKGWKRRRNRLVTTYVVGHVSMIKVNLDDRLSTNLYISIHQAIILAIGILASNAAFR